MDDKLAHLRNRASCNVSTTLIDTLRRAAAEEPDRLYINLLDTRNQETRLTFADVLQGTERWARFLLHRGLTPHARVALLLPSSQTVVCALYGTQMAGGVPVPCPYPVALGDATPYILSLENIIRRARPELLITTEQLKDAATQLMGNANTVILAEEVADTDADLDAIHTTPDDAALIQFTSGPVFDPTGAVLTHSNILANVQGLGQALALTRDDVALNWVPLVQDMGLVGGLFTSLYYRCPLHVMPPQAFLMRPYLWLKNISDYKATLSVAPNFAYQLCVRRVRDKQLQGIDLSSWRVALTGAETVYASTVEAFREKFAPVGLRATTITPTYGLAENTLATAMPDLADPYRTAPHPEGEGNTVVAVGGPMLGQELAIQDADGQILGEREVGEITVRGPCVMQRYDNNGDATAHALRGEWLHTGDLGFITEGQLFITGRKKEMVIKMGRNYYPDDIEQVASQNRGPTVAFACSNSESGTEDLVVVQEADVSGAEAEKQLHTEINADLLSILGIRADRIILVPAGSLVADRSEARARFGKEASA